MSTACRPRLIESKRPFLGRGPAASPRSGVRKSSHRRLAVLGSSTFQRN
jgi:hypothetical protein